KPFTDDELHDASIKANSTSIVAVTMIVAAVAFCLGLLVTGSIFFSAILMALAPVTVKMFVNRRLDKRRAKFADQVEEAMQLFSSSLKAGMNVPTAMAAVSRDV